jgi:D-sedoheptulose 7-phosphate isomerase
MKGRSIKKLDIDTALEIPRMEVLFSNNGSKADFAAGYLQYHAELINRLDKNVIADIMQKLMEAWQRDRTLFIIGNGGSAARASHFANDLNIGTRARGDKPLRAVSLVDNIAVITALANDEGYENIFVYQLDGMLKPGDVVLAFSVSGNSANILEAVRFAKKQGVCTIGCTGFDGGILNMISDISFHIPTLKGEYGPVEDIFTVFGHLIYTYFRIQRKGRL